MSVTPAPPAESPPAPAAKRHVGGGWWRWPLRLVAGVLILLSLLLSAVWAYSYSQELVILRLPTAETVDGPDGTGTGRGLIAFDGTLIYKRGEQLLPFQEPWVIEARPSSQNGGVIRDRDTPPPTYGLTWGETRQGPGWYVGVSLFLAVAVLFILAAILLLIARRPKPETVPAPVEEPRHDT